MCDLTKNPNNDKYRQEFARLIENVKLSSLKANEELNLKVGDVVSFYGGYNGDIRYTAEILGFDEHGLAYMLWDCYWFAIDLVKREYELLNQQPC